MLKNPMNFLKTTLRFVVPLLVLSVVFAQTDPCHIPGGHYRTQTQGGWHTDCHGNNPGCILQNNFGTVFPSGLTIGGGYTIHFSTYQAVRAFLPAVSTPSVLTANLNNPTTSPAGVFAGQVLTLAINLGFSNASVAGFNSNLGNLIIPTGVHTPTGAFAGWTVNQLFALANTVLGGNTGALPAGITVSDLNNAVDAINNCFDNGTASTGYLVDPNCDHILPVEISSFAAAGDAGDITVQWTTASERDIVSYQLNRRTDETGWQSVAVVSSHGNSASGFHYEYRDADVVSGTTYQYQLVYREVTGNVTTHTQTVSASPAASIAPADYVLEQNYPNPFNPTTSIAFTLKEAGLVRLSVFDVLGREVAVLMNGNQAAGSYNVSFNASALPTGVYLYRLEAGSFSAVRKLVLLK